MLGVLLIHCTNHLSVEFQKDNMSEAKERVENNEAVDAKRNVKPTAKALAYKVENLQNERKTRE